MSNHQLTLKDLLSAYQILSGLSVDDFADEFGVSVPAIRNWLSGQSSPHPSMRIEWKTAALIRNLVEETIHREATGWIGYSSE